MRNKFVLNRMGPCVKSEKGEMRNGFGMQMNIYGS